MTQKRHVMHGRDHRPDGADPLPGFTLSVGPGAPPGVWDMQLVAPLYPPGWTTPEPPAGYNPHIIPGVNHGRAWIYGWSEARAAGYIIQIRQVLKCVSRFYYRVDVWASNDTAELDNYHEEISGVVVAEHVSGNYGPGCEDEQTAWETIDFPGLDTLNNFLFVPIAQIYEGAAVATMEGGGFELRVILPDFVVADDLPPPGDEGDVLLSEGGSWSSGKVGSASIEDGSIVDADVAAGAAIAKSKLAPLAIADADVDAAAEISVSKLLEGGDGEVLTTVAGVPVWAEPADADALDWVGEWGAGSTSYTSPSFRAVATAESSSDTAFTANKPTGTIEGDAMLAHLWVQDGPGQDAITVPSGWTLLTSRRPILSGSNQWSVFTYYKLAGASEPSSYTWADTTAARAFRLAILTYQDVDNADPISGTPAETLHTSGSSLVSGSVTTERDGAMLVMLVGSAGTNTGDNVTPPSGMTERYELTLGGTSSRRIEASDVVGGTAGAVSKTATVPYTMSSSAPGTSTLVALNPAEVSASEPYEPNDVVAHDGALYVCIADTTGATDAESEPGVGTDWETYWALMLADTDTTGADATQPQVRLTRTASQTGIASATTTYISWDSETYDPDGMHDNATNPTRITIPTDKGGIYMVTLQLLVTGGAGAQKQAGWRKNGSVFPASISIPAGSSQHYLSFTTQLKLAAGDYLEAYVFQDSGSAQSALKDNDISPVAALTRISL
jgi:hypothetical protein